MLLKKFFVTITILASAGLGFAAPPSPPPSSKALADQALQGISTGCTTALVAIVTSPEFLKCVPLNAFIPLVPIVLNPGEIKQLLQDPLKNIPPIVEPFSDVICAAPKCSDQGVGNALKSVQTACKDDLKNQLIQAVIFGLTFYSPARDILCFKDQDPKKPEYCTIDLLKTVFTLPKSPIQLTKIPQVDNVIFADPKSLCTVCNKNIVNTILNFLGAHPDAKALLEQLLGPAGAGLDVANIGVAFKCGAGFVDGKVGK